MPLLLLVGTGIVALATNVGLANAAWSDPELVPKLYGWDARKIGFAAGVVGLLIGGPVLGTLGAGVLIGTAIGAVDLGMFKDAIVAFKKSNPNALPFGGDTTPELPAPPTDPGAAPDPKVGEDVYGWL